MSTSNPPNTGDIVRLTTFCQQGTQAGINVYHGVVTRTLTGGADLSEILAVWNTEMAAVLKPCLNNQASFKGGAIQNVWPLPVGGVVYSGSSAGAGTGGATALPQQVSGIITWGTILAGRRYRGRSYIPFPSTAQNDTDDTPTAAYVTLLNAIGTRIKTGITVVGAAGNSKVSFEVYRRTLPNDSALIMNYVSRKKWATQRRRGNYGQPNTLPV